MKWILDHRVNKVASNFTTMLGVTLILAWCEGPFWHLALLCAAMVLANVTGHGEGLTRSTK